MIHFTCPCGHAFSVQPAYAGREGPCPSCGRRVTVPSTGRQPTGQFKGTLTPPVGLSDATPAPPTRPGARLQVVHGPPAARDTTLAIPADRPAVLGRDPAADLPIPSERISRHHCRFLTAPNGAVAVEDLGSSNGTLVNQQRISGRRILVSGDYVQAGDCLFRILLG